MTLTAVKRQLIQLRRLDPERYAESIQMIRQAPHLAGVVSAAGLKAVIAKRPDAAEASPATPAAPVAADNIEKLKRDQALPAWFGQAESIEDWV